MVCSGFAVRTGENKNVISVNIVCVFGPISAEAIPKYSIYDSDGSEFRQRALLNLLEGKDFLPNHKTLGFKTAWWALCTFVTISHTYVCLAKPGLL